MDKLIADIKELGEPVLYETGGNREFISSNIYKLTGYYAEEIRVNRDLFPGLINPEDYIETNFKIKSWHKNNEPGVLGLCFRFMSSSGQQVWIEDFLIGLKDGENKFMQGMMIEITAYKEKVASLLRLRTDWRDNNEADSKEKETVFKDIDKKLEALLIEEKNRHAKATEVLEFVQSENIRFSDLDLNFLNAR